MKNNSDIFVQTSAIIFEKTFESFPVPTHLKPELVMEGIGNFNEAELQRLKDDLVHQERVSSTSTKKAFFDDSIAIYREILKEDDLTPDERSKIETMIADFEAAMQEPMVDPQDLVQKRSQLLDLELQRKRWKFAVESTLSFHVSEGFLREVRPEHQDWQSDQYQLTAKGLKLLGYEFTKGKELKSTSRFSKLKEAIKKGSTALAGEALMGMIFG